MKKFTSYLIFISFILVKDLLASSFDISDIKGKVFYRNNYNQELVNILQKKKIKKLKTLKTNFNSSVLIKNKNSFMLHLLPKSMINIRNSFIELRRGRVKIKKENNSIIKGISFSAGTISTNNSEVEVTFSRDGNIFTLLVYKGFAQIFIDNKITEIKSGYIIQYDKLSKIMKKPLRVNKNQFELLKLNSFKIKSENKDSIEKLTKYPKGVPRILFSTALQSNINLKNKKTEIQNSQDGVFIDFSNGSIHQVNEKEKHNGSLNTQTGEYLYNKEIKINNININRLRTSEIEDDKIQQKIINKKVLNLNNQEAPSLIGPDSPLSNLPDYNPNEDPFDYVLDPPLVKSSTLWLEKNWDDFQKNKNRNLNFLSSGRDLLGSRNTNVNIIVELD
jgi:hypothetical protein